MRKFKQPLKMTRAIDTVVTRETTTRDSQTNPEGTTRSKEKATHKTLQMATVDTRMQGYETMRKDLGKIKLKVGLLKTWILKPRGSWDGKLGLPRPDKNERWISPFMAKEQHVAETFKAQKWCEHEISVSVKQEKAQQLTLEIIDIEDALAHKRKQEPPKLSEQELSTVFNHELCGDAGILRSRRQKEWSKKNASYYAAVRVLSQKADDLKQRRAELLAAVDESACITRLLCEKKCDLHRQRVDIYYQGVLKTHPERKSMPPVPECVWENFAEKLYDKQHKNNNKEDE